MNYPDYFNDNVDQIAVSFAEKLRRFRTEAGFSQKNVAEILNISRPTYTYYETGKTSPDVATLTRLSRIFGVPIEEFFPTVDENGELAENDFGGNGSHASVLRDPNGEPAFSQEIHASPQKVGDLSVDEKTIIAFIRDRNLSAEKALELLKRFYTEPDVPKTY